MTAWIQTFTGRKFSLRCPCAADIELEDIAHALSNLCRFNGHTRKFYSVAQHALIVSQALERGGADMDACLWGLHHDDGEAYIGDLCTPIKHGGKMRAFVRLENEILLCVAAKLKLPWPVPDAVAVADKRALMAEARDLMARPPSDWGYQKIKPLDEKIEPMNPALAKMFWMMRHESLTKRRAPIGYD